MHEKFTTFPNLIGHKFNWTEVFGDFLRDKMQEEILAKNYRIVLTNRKKHTVSLFRNYHDFHLVKPRAMVICHKRHFKNVSLQLYPQ